MLQRQLASAQRQGEALEGRLAAAEMATARANAEVRAGRSVGVGGES